jgi:3-methyl-2-oxobutanoate hydroxymethyltransferase
MAKITHLDLARKKAEGTRIVVITAYDYSGALLADAAGVDVILVGDSLGNVVQGHDTTLPVTLDHMVYHAACVTRAKPNAQVVVDLPFGTFQLGATEALRASVRLVQEAAAEAVKIEGAGERLRAIEMVAKADIPVWAHVGLTPQSVHVLGGFRVQGRDAAKARAILDQAVRAEAAGACAIVLECIPTDLAREITDRLEIPTIGIGAGVHCDGQVLVYHDLLGFFEHLGPKFVKRYAETGRTISDAIRRYADEVRSGRFPTADHSYGALQRQVEGAEDR